MHSEHYYLMHTQGIHLNLDESEKEDLNQYLSINLDQTHLPKLDQN